MNTTRNALVTLTIAATAGLASTTAVTTASAAAPSDAAAGSIASSSKGVKSATDIPWASVGDGWTAATSERGGTTALLLVSPQGQTYRVATLAEGEGVTAVSRDGKHIITSHRVGEKDESRVWDAASGKSASLPTGGEYAFAGHDEIIGITGHGVFSRLSSVTGRQTSRQTVDKELKHPVASPDGQHVAVETADGVEVHESAHFNSPSIRRLPTPKGATTCTIKGWSSDRTVTTACSGGGRTEVYAQASDGSRTLAMTRGVKPGQVNGGGWSDALDTPSGRLAIPATNAAPDLVSEVALLHGDKVSRTLPLKGFNPDAGDFTGSMQVDSLGRSSVMVSTPQLGYASPNWSIGRYDLPTKKFVYLAGHHSQFGGTPTSYVTIDARH